MKRTILFAGLLLAALAGAYFLGAESHPARVELREVERVKVVERVVEVQSTAAARRVVVIRDRTTSPDGTRREHTEARTESRASSETRAAVDRTEAREVERVEVRESRPAWRLAVMVGAPLRLEVPALVYGVQLDRRLLGPLSLGAWALSSRAAGLSLSLEF